MGDKVLYSETDFVGKSKKFAAKWTGPVSIVKIKGGVVIIKLAFGSKALLQRGRGQMLSPEQLHDIKQKISAMTSAFTTTIAA